VRGLRFPAAILLLACSSAGLASVPPQAPDFKSTTSTYSGPGSIGFSGFCVKLKAGETAKKVQFVPWANQTFAELAEGQLIISENSSGYSGGLGKRFRKVNGGWLLKAREYGRSVYYFDNAMPGSTQISFIPKSRNVMINRVLDRFDFDSTC
jgi:hypothetical protein